MSVIVLFLLVVGLILATTRLIEYLGERSLDFSPDMLAVIGRGLMPGWHLDVYGIHVVVQRIPGRYRTGGLWLLGDPDHKGWRIGRRISHLRLATLMQSTTKSGEDAS